MIESICCGISAFVCNGLIIEVRDNANEALYDNEQAVTIV